VFKISAISTQACIECRTSLVNGCIDSVLQSVACCAKRLAGGGGGAVVTKCRADVMSRNINDTQKRQDDLTESNINAC